MFVKEVKYFKEITDYNFEKIKEIKRLKVFK